MAALFLVGLGAPAVGAPCTLAGAVRSHAAGAELAAAGERVKAIHRLRGLAELGIAPSQAGLAGLLGGEGASPGDLEDAYRWALLASRGAMREAGPLAQRLGARLGAAGRARAETEAGQWSPARGRCAGTWKESGRIGERQFLLDGRPVEMAPNLAARLIEPAYLKLRSVLGNARHNLGAAAWALDFVGSWDIFYSDRYDRYAGTAPGSDRMRLTVSVFLDKQPEHAERILAMGAARMAFAHFEGASIDDRHVRIIEGKRVYGSLYSDIDNGRFYKAMGNALRLARGLPADVRRYIAVVDEIHYNPPSKYFKRGGAIDAALAYYNRRISGPGQRIISIRRDIKWGSDLDMMLHVVHEGVHALQDDRAERAQAAVADGQKRLAGLPPASAEAEALTAEIAAEQDHAGRWFNGVGAPGARHMQDIRFECEALIAEIKAARAVQAPNTSLDRSQYLGTCPEAQRLVVTWKDEAFTARAIQ